jgi:uncharacterized membrane protein YecN with MAPEG domain
MRIPHVALGLKYSPLFVGLVSLSITALAINTTRLRNKLNIWAGDGGNDALRRAARAHGNAVEHGVVAAVLLILLEWQRGPVWAVVTLGIAVVAARAAHAAGMLIKDRSIWGLGVALTYLSELLLSLWVVVNALRAI